MMNHRDLQAPAPSSNASLEHEHYKELVVKRYRQMGYDVRKEFQIGQSRAVDLVAANS